MNRPVAAALILVASVASAAAQDLPKTQVTVIGNIGITTQSKQLEAPFWAKTVPDASKGAITANFKPWNELGLKGPEVFRILGRGQATFGHGQLGHAAGDAPINDGNDLAGMSPDWATFRKATEAFRPVLTAFYEKNLGLRPVTLQSYQSQVLYCRPEIRGLADLKGKRVRTSGASQSDFIAHFGGVPVDMAFGEVQQALTQGTIDCSITGTLGGYSAKWTGARFLYTLPINYGANAIVANVAEFNKLDPKVQAFLSAKLKELEGEMWALNQKEDEVGIACNTTGPCPLGEPAGMKRVDPTPEDIALRRTALLDTVLPRWGQRCGADCVKDWNATVGKVVDLQVK